MEVCKMSLFLLFCGLVSSDRDQEYKLAGVRGLERTVPLRDDPVVVHVVPHTHDDVGWIKTVDQYYFGTKDEVDNVGVQYIIDSVIEELSSDREKTFIYVEIVYFKKWWENQDKTMHDKVRKLIKNKQLEFVNGGYSMNDEGTVHYLATIDQMSAGLVWLTENFGGMAEPTVAWQIDTFGHSTAQAALSKQMGLNGTFFARIHYQDYNRRKANKELEYNWHVEGEDMFTGVLYRNYNAPPSFCFDSQCTDPPIVTDETSPEYNLPERVAAFLEYLNEQASDYRSGNIMLTMGGDFCYQNAHQYFKNLDILMKYVNENSTSNGFRMIYSTPSRYMKSVVESIGSSLTNKTDDHFPYADGPHSYWTGYFTSRPTFKGYVRECSSMLQTCRQVEVLVGSPKCDADSLWLALGVAQHHDAITGTSKQHVTDDYTRRLAVGQTYCEKVINRGLEQLAGLSQGRLESCRLANESYCGVTSDHGNSSFTVVVYNPKPVSRSEYIRIPLLHPNYQLIDLSTDKAVLLYFVGVNPIMRRINPAALPFEGVFLANLPGMGYSSYKLQNTPYPRYSHVLTHQNVNNDIRVESQVYTVLFDGSTGSMKSITNKLSGITDKLSATYMEYRSNTGDSVDKQPSGAYIFRPMKDEADKVGTSILTKHLVGAQFSEIWQTYTDWLHLVTRVYQDKHYIEVEWIVGPIPVDHGREIILRYETSLVTDKKFYTDSNGREMMQRILNKQPTWEVNVTEPISGNYYPVNTRAVLIDEQRNTQFTVLTDRSQGGTSLSDGQIELMLHRRILKDDMRGVEEALNETRFGHGLIAKGRHWLFYSGFEDISRSRVMGLDMLYKPTVAVGLDETPQHPKQSYSGPAVNKENLNVLTVINVDYSGDVFTYLLRLENIHPVYEGGKPISVDLGGVFKGKTLVKFEEKGLAGDRPISHITDVKQHTMYDSGNIITLQPLQIRTFFATYKPSNHGYSNNGDSNHGNGNQGNHDEQSESDNDTEEMFLVF